MKHRAAGYSCTPHPFPPPLASGIWGRTPSGGSISSADSTTRTGKFARCPDGLRQFAVPELEFVRGQSLADLAGVAGRGRPSHAGGPRQLSSLLRGSRRFWRRFRGQGPHLRTAFTRFEDGSAFRAFCRREHYWLEDYAQFRVLKDLHGGRSWTEWEDEYKLRRQKSLRQLSKTHAEALRYHKFLQYLFHRQWETIHAHAHAAGIRIIGDIPCYVSFDSADTWASRDLFEFDSQCRPTRVAGVPPDYFSENGQLWGNPLYRWMS